MIQIATRVSGWWVSSLAYTIVTQVTNTHSKWSDLKKYTKVPCTWKTHRSALRVSVCFFHNFIKNRKERTCVLAFPNCRSFLWKWFLWHQNPSLPFSSLYFDSCHCNSIHNSTTEQCHVHPRPSSEIVGGPSSHLSGIPFNVSLGAHLGHPMLLFPGPFQLFNSLKLENRLGFS